MPLEPVISVTTYVNLYILLRNVLCDKTTVLPSSDSVQKYLLLDQTAMLEEYNLRCQMLHLEFLDYKPVLPVSQANLH